MKRRRNVPPRTLILCICCSAFFFLLFYNILQWPYETALGDGNLLDFGDGLQVPISGIEGELPLPKVVKLGGDSADLGTRPNKTFKQDLGACKIPKLELNGPDVVKFFKKFPPLVCSSGKPKPWVYIDDERKIQPTKYAKSQIGVGKMACTWSFYERLNDRKLKWMPKEQFKFGDLVERGDYLKVDCQTDNRNWSNPFMVVVPKTEKVAILEEIRKNRPIGEPYQPLSVYMLSFDSLSQMSFRRNLPKTVAYLENEMKSAVFNGYNIVGDGTPQAWIPILTGQTEEELPLTRKRYREAHYVDEVYPFVWRNLSDAGFATMYSEDGHDFGTFTYRLKGFKEKPTDHYPITFFHYSERISSDKLCIGSEKQHNVWFRYIESFWREYGKLGVPRFSAMHHSYLSHDDLNRVQQVDDDLAAHLRRMNEAGLFDNTLAIVMADHGSRFSELRLTHQGQLEERLPFFSVHLPSSFRESSDERLRLAWKNIQRNAMDRLSSPFDVHPTLLDAIRWPLPLDELKSPHRLSDSGSSAKNTVPPRGRSLSLFREIPLKRTCAEAGIEPHWCTCLGWQPLIGEVRETRVLARSVVKLINDYTQSERKLCADLKLKSIVNAKRLVPNDELLKYSGASDKDGFVPELKGNVNTTFATYQIVFETEPGGAVYEVTLFYDGIQVTVDWNAISHINKYGDTPHCIIDKNYFMATFCVCYDKV